MKKKKKSKQARKLLDVQATGQKQGISSGI